MIMGRTAAAAGQPGRNGHTRAHRREKHARVHLGEKLRLGVPHTEPHLWDVSALGLVYPLRGNMESCLNLS